MKHVLIVEDDPVNAMVVRTVLTKRGCYRVTVTEDATQILASCASGDVDLVVMDVSLANTRWQGKPITGVELCRRLKSDSKTAAIPVLLATAHAMRGDAEKLMAGSGADAYVSKPILDHAEFVRQVSTLLERAA